MKECNKCHEVKPLDEFSLNRRRKDGLESTCRTCRAEAQRAWRKAHPLQVSDYSRRAYMKRESVPPEVRIRILERRIARNTEALRRDIEELKSLEVGA